MYKTICPLPILLITIYSVFAQSVYTGMGARAEGMGNASAALTDGWGTFNNPAALAWVKNPSVLAAYSSAPFMPGADRRVGALIWPLKQWTSALGVFRFGDEVYSETLVSASFANRLGMAGLGSRISYVQFSASQFGTHGLITLDVGGIAELTPQLFIGAWIMNLNHTRPNPESYPAPVKMQAALCFIPSDKVVLTTEVHKHLLHDVTWKGGVEYRIHPRIHLRTGFNIKPSATFFGTGFRLRRLQLDYALQYSPYLRSLHQGSVTYNLHTP
jgi:hypothetical protein